MSYLQTLMKNVSAEEIEQQNKMYQVISTKENTKVDSDELKTTKSKKFSKTKTTKDNDFINAINEAQKMFIEETLPSESDNDKIVSCIENMKKWSAYVNVNIENDIKITYNDKEYSFSKKRLLEGRYFQNMVKNFYIEKYGNVGLSFFPNRKIESLYTIKIFDK